MFVLQHPESYSVYNFINSDSVLKSICRNVTFLHVSLKWYKKIPGAGSFYYKDKAELFQPMYRKHTCLTELFLCRLKKHQHFHLDRNVKDYGITDCAYSRVDGREGLL